MTSSGFSSYDVAALCAYLALLTYPILPYFDQFYPKTPKNIPVFTLTLFLPCCQISTPRKSDLLLHNPIKPLIGPCLRLHNHTLHDPFPYGHVNIYMDVTVWLDQLWVLSLGGAKDLSCACPDFIFCRIIHILQEIIDDILRIVRCGTRFEVTSYVDYIIT